MIVGIAVRASNIQGGRMFQIHSAEEFAHAFADARVLIISPEQAGQFRAAGLRDCCAVFRHKHFHQKLGTPVPFLRLARKVPD